MNSNSKNLIKYNILIYPTKEQKILFDNYLEYCIYVYNLSIELYDDLEKISGMVTYKKLEKLYNKLITEDEDYKFLSKFNINIAHSILKNVFIKINNYNTNNSLYKKPTIINLNKSYNSKKYCPLTNDIIISKNSIIIPYFGELQTDNNRESIQGSGVVTENIYIKVREYKDIRLLKSDNSYYISFYLSKERDKSYVLNSCNNFILNPIWNNMPYSEIIGIDIGCKGNNWLVTSNGIKIALPDTSKEELKIERMQQVFNRKREVNCAKNSKNKNIYSKGELETLEIINKKYQRIINKKLTTLNEFSSLLISYKPLAIVIEDISEESILSNADKFEGDLAKYNYIEMVQNAIINLIRNNILTKCKANNILVIIADKQFASTQFCSNCGNRQYIGNSFTYQCQCCGMVKDRDKNAADNLKNYGYLILNNYYKNSLVYFE